MATNQRLLCERCGPKALAEVCLTANPIGDKNLCRKCAYSNATKEPCACQSLPMDVEKATLIDDPNFRPVLEFGKVIAWHCDYCKVSAFTL